MKDCQCCRERLIHEINSDLQTINNAFDRVHENLGVLLEGLHLVDLECPEFFKAYHASLRLAAKVGQWES